MYIATYTKANFRGARRGNAPPKRLLPLKA